MYVCTLVPGVARRIQTVLLPLRLLARFVVVIVMGLRH